MPRVAHRQKSQRGENSLSAESRKEAKTASAPKIAMKTKQPQRRKSQRGQQERKANNKGPEETQGQQWARRNARPAVGQKKRKASMDQKKRNASSGPEEA
jgi:hypothetical protein